MNDQLGGDQGIETEEHKSGTLSSLSTVNQANGSHSIQFSPGNGASMSISSRPGSRVININENSNNNIHSDMSTGIIIRKPKDDIYY